MATLLLELFSEEIPARMQRGAAEQLQRLIVSGFEKAELAAKEVRTFVSPRHLAIELIGLPEMQKDVTEERKGPRVGAPEQAMKGFLNAVGLKAEQCDQKDGYYFTTIHRKGRPTTEVAKEIIEAALATFVWPKSMRWGAASHAWVRPLHRIVCLLDKKIIPVQFAGLIASNITEGHRFLHQGTVTIADAAQYMETLKKAHVMVDFLMRRDWVKLEVENLAKLHTLSVIQDDHLLDEVTGLVEWPVPLFGSFDKTFLELPKEVLISEMKVHQRYFALQDAKGTLSNHFIAVANMVSSDGGKKIIAGNERVLRARLSDGAFYWEQDRKKPLSDWANGLADIVFHAKVGAVSDKVVRIEKLALSIAREVGFKDTKSVTRTAQLCKADLTTGMVGEFPELQGIMGRYYALAQKEPQAVADAIRDHYKPLGAADSLPESELAAIIAIADKLDSIISLFAAGEKPTGSKDPFALRRAALGSLRITRQFRWNIDLAGFTKDTDVIEFFRDRLKNLLREDGLKHDVVDAALNVKEKSFVPVLIAEQAHNLAKWMANKEGESALAAIKRALNILAVEEKKAKLSYSFIDSKLTALSDPAEKALLKDLKANKATKPADLNKLADPINTFFDKVLVNVEDAKLREARLSLLAGVREAALQIADFSRIEG